jgi:hypothetical protein
VVVSKIVAMARFHYPHKMPAEERSTRESNPFGLLPEGSNVKLCQEFFEKLEHYEGQHLDKENTYCAFEPPFPSADLSMVSNANY